MRGIRAIVYGVGALGRIMTKLMIEKGVEIVGAIDVTNVGKDLGEVVGLGYRLNVLINDNGDAVLSERRADIAVVAIFDEMERMYPIFRKCIENGLNVITTGCEASYPWKTSPELASNLDKLAKKYGVTITGSGNQDFFMMNAGSLMAGTCHSIESVTFRLKSNTYKFGPVVQRVVHVGETKEEFYEFYKKVKEQGKEPLNDYLFFLLNFIADLGVTIKKIEQSTEPTIDNIDLKCEALGKTVKKGLVTGTHQIVEIDTEQGIKLRGEYTLKLCPEHEKDEKEWIIKGVPNLSLKFGELATELTTCTQMINRIPDVLNSEPGYITVERLPKLKFRAFPLEYYVKE